LGVKESIAIIFRVKKVAGKGEFQDGRQNVRRPTAANPQPPLLQVSCCGPGGQISIDCWTGVQQQ